MWEWYGKKYICYTYDITSMWNLKYDTDELICRTETDPQTQKTNLSLPKGKREAEG